MQPLSTVSFLVLASLLASPVAAQPQRSDAGAPVTPAAALIRGDSAAIEFDVAADGTVWVRGRTYKASFGVEGVAYVPFFGSGAPRNYPLALAPARVTVGDVVVALAFQTDLNRDEDADGFRFANELGHVRYGRAFAVDSRGDKDPIESRLGADTIELRVPRAVAARAELPLVIDPVLSTFVVGDLAHSERATDTAYDLSDAHYFTVYEDVFSASDIDVRGVRYCTPSTFKLTNALRVVWLA